MPKNPSKPAIDATTFLQASDKSLTEVYAQLCKTNPAAADAFLFLLGDWREKTTRLKTVLSNL
jgi:hypothetical protein